MSFESESASVGSVNAPPSMWGGPHSQGEDGIRDGKMFLVAIACLAFWVVLLSNLFNRFEISYVMVWFLAAPAFQLLEAFIVGHLAKDDENYLFLTPDPTLFFLLRVHFFNDFLGVLLEASKLENDIFKHNLDVDSKEQFAVFLYKQMHRIATAVSLVCVLIVMLIYSAIFLPLHFIWMFFVGSLPRTLLRYVLVAQGGEKLPGLEEGTRTSLLLKHPKLGSSIVPFSLMLSAAAIFLLGAIAVGELSLVGHALAWLEQR